MNMKFHPFAIAGWVLGAAFLLSLVGLTAAPMPTGEVQAGAIEVIHAQL